MSDIVMYLLMRNDIPSMNPGKLAAQASHVSNACVYNIKNNKNKKINGMLKIWENQTVQGFGTAICLSVTEKDIFDISVFNRENFIFDYVYDPSYPCYIPTEVAKFMHSATLEKDGYQVIVKDGENSIFLRPELVGAYMFGDKEEMSKYVERFKLYP